MKIRHYRQWAGDEHGQHEREGYCIATVHDDGRSCLSHQCRKKRANGTEFCPIHKNRGRYVPEPSECKRRASA